MNSRRHLKISRPGSNVIGKNFSKNNQSRKNHKDTKSTKILCVFVVFWFLIAGLCFAQETVPGEEKAPPEDDSLLQGENRLLPSPNLHQWGAVTLFHGLPSNHVRAIAQDDDGVLWFGTNGGLAKYDGRRT